MKYIQITVASSLPTASSLAMSIPVLFVSLGNTGHRGEDLTQAIVFQTQITGVGSKGGHATQQGPIGSSAGIFQLILKEEWS